MRQNFAFTLPCTSLFTLVEFFHQTSFIVGYNIIMFVLWARLTYILFTWTP